MPVITTVDKDELRAVGYKVEVLGVPNCYWYVPKLGKTNVHLGEKDYYCYTADTAWEHCWLHYMEQE